MRLLHAIFWHHWYYPQRTNSREIYQRWCSCGKTQRYSLKGRWVDYE